MLVPCTKCGLEKSSDSFYKNKRKSNGLTSWCKDCLNVAHKDWYRKNPDKHRGYVRKWVAANPERSREIQRAGYDRWAERHPEERREHFQRWYRKNPEKVRELILRREALENDASGHATKEQIAARVALFGGKCWMCGAPWEAIDHVIALSRGGSNWPANLRPACKSCNSRKKNRDWRTFGYRLFGREGHERGDERSLRDPPSSPQRPSPHVGRRLVEDRAAV